MEILNCLRLGDCRALDRVAGDVVLIVAAVIDGFELKVPNWITFPFIISGWTYSTAAFGWEGLGWSLAGHRSWA